MTDEPNEDPGAAPSPRSVLTFIEERTGEAPRISLRDDATGGGAPVIDPGTQERLALPQGRGTYQLMGEIARGGMGVVLRGHDTDLGRDVAMKVLSKELASRADVVQRFVEEAQIGGQLQHPGIVPVYELGLMADERPYFTMKLVKGRTLASLLAERESPGVEHRRMLDIFHSICQTVAYAHSRGVIHRDLKPANVMVGAFGEVQVVDWGLAKVLARGGTADEREQRKARTAVTVLETVRSEGSGSGSDSLVGSVMGTPAYMPPEQASGMVDRLDERSDVFSLGAILCEILTGLPPYDGEGERTLIQAAQAEIETAVTRLDASTADPELVKLTKQCLMPALVTRPRNAGVLAERIREHLESNEERAHAARVEAAEARVREDEAVRHARQERRARKLTLALAASVLAMLALGGGGWVWVQGQSAARERAVAEREHALETEVNVALNEASLLQGSERWSEAALAVERARTLSEGADASEPLRARVAAAAEGLGELEAAARRRDEVTRQNAALLAELAGVREPAWDDTSDANLADWDGTRTQYADAFRRHGVELDPDDPVATAEALGARGFGPELALVLDAWAEACRRAGDPEAALHLIDLAHQVDPDPLRADLREALANQELEALVWIADSELEDQPPATLELLGASLLRLGDRERGLAVYRTAVELHPTDFALQYGFARALTPAWNAEKIRPELHEAARRYHAAQALRPDHLGAQFFMGRTFDFLEEHHAAARTYERCLELRPDDALLLYRLGGAVMKGGDDERALPLLARAIELGGVHWWAAWSHWHAGQIRARRGDLEAAEEHGRAAIGMLPNRTVWLTELPTILQDAGGEAEALAALREAVDRLPDDIAAQNNLAWFLATARIVEQRDPEAAVYHARVAVDLDPTEGNSWNTLGVALYGAGELEEAVEVLARSMAMTDGGGVHDWLYTGMAQHDLGREDVARVWYDRAIAWIATHGADAEERQALDEAERVLGL